MREALDRVEELQESNIFPPQVTIAAWQLQKEGKLNRKAMLPVTVAEGKRAFSSLPRAKRDRAESEKSFGKPEKEPVVAAFRDLSVSYRTVKGEPHVVFDRLNLQLHKGEKIALIGSNGAGKSTLMKLMVGLLKPSQGTVQLNDRILNKIKPEQLSRQISLVYQNPEEMFIKDSIRKDIAYAMQVRQVENWEQRTEELLRRFHLQELGERDGRLLSGGQMRRASLAIGVALNPGILLLDEPTANLDIATRKEIMRTLNDMKEITETVMIATHDMQLVCEWAERIIVLYKGRIVGDGTRNEIFGDEALTKQVGIRPPEIFSMGRELDENALCYTVQEFLQMFEGGGADDKKTVRKYTG